MIVTNAIKSNMIEAFKIRRSKRIENVEKNNITGWDADAAYESHCERCYEREFDGTRYDGEKFNAIKMYYDDDYELCICGNCIDKYIEEL